MLNFVNYLATHVFSYNYLLLDITRVKYYVLFYEKSQNKLNMNEFLYTNQLNESKDIEKNLR